jgi:hypothetical protein
VAGRPKSAKLSNRGHYFASGEMMVAPMLERADAARGAEALFGALFSKAIVTV